MSLLGKLKNEAVKSLYVTSVYDALSPTVSVIHCAQICIEVADGHFIQYCDIMQCFKNYYVLHSSCFNFVITIFTFTSLS